MLLGSRKFLVTLAGLSLGGYLQWSGKLDTAGATLIAGLVSGYLASNVGTKAVTK